ncbi:MAG: DMT family transporter [Candidatus Accumulibacter sp.]|nr:DMT family transporter [Accumulibacter sp.]
MSRALTFSLTLLAMIAFAGNSLLCRLALKHSSIDAASFTTIRIVSGALALWLILRLRAGTHTATGSWPSALALFAYAGGFSYAYVSLPAAAGALLLFGAVQATMIGYGLWAGERLTMRQSTGLLLAFGGLAILLFPGLSAPPVPGSLLMLGAGVAWGIYSLRGKGAGDPICATAGNFLRATPMAAALSVVMLPWSSLDALDALDGVGVCYAIASGALASGLGYAVWYTALRGLKATSAASVQLSVPIIAAVGGIVFLGETISVRLVIASAAILGGIALVIVGKQADRR